MSLQERKDSFEPAVRNWNVFPLVFLEDLFVML